MPFGNPWKKKDSESEEEFKARTDKMRAKSRENVTKAQAARAEKRDRKPNTPAEQVSVVSKAALSQTVSFINGLVAMVSPPDVLTPEEGTMLVEAAIQQQQTSKTFRKYLGRFVGAAGSASFIGAVAMIVYVRLERRGLVPSMTGQPVTQPEPVQGPVPFTPAGNADFWEQQEYERNHPEQTTPVEAF